MSLLFHDFFNVWRARIIEPAGLLPTLERRHNRIGYYQGKRRVPKSVAFG